MNVHCMIDNVEYYLNNNQKFTSFCCTDSSGVGNHIFKYYCDDDTVYPVAVLSNGPQDILFGGDLIVNWETSVILKIFAIKDNIIKPEEEGCTDRDSGDLLYKFMKKLDGIMKEICGFGGVPIKNIKLIEGPLMEEPEVEHQGKGELLTATYVFTFEPGGN